MVSKLFLELVLKDLRSSKVIYCKRFKSHSYVLNFVKILQGLFITKGGYDLSDDGLKAYAYVVKDDGATIDAWTEWYNPSSTYGAGGGTPIAVNAPEGDDTYGILVGSDATPVSYNDYNLKAKIPHGSTDGKLYYGPMSIGIVTTTGAPQFGISRTFTNAGSADVTVAEVGIIARNYWKNAAEVKRDVKYLIIRDVLTESVTVKPLTSLTVSYIFVVE